MNLNFESTKLIRVNDIKIPDVFNRRLKTGINKIDVLFDEGILPGSAHTLTAQAGCGKCHGPNEVIEVYGDAELIARLNAFVQQKNK